MKRPNNKQTECLGCPIHLKGKVFESRDCPLFGELKQKDDGTYFGSQIRPRTCITFWRKK